jgi:hypothetical protein
VDFSSGRLEILQNAFHSASLKIAITHHRSLPLHGKQPHGSASLQLLNCRIPVLRAGSLEASMKAGPKSVHKASYEERSICWPLPVRSLFSIEARIPNTSRFIEAARGCPGEPRKRMECRSVPDKIPPGTRLPHS